MCNECEKDGRVRDFSEFIPYFTLQEMKKLSKKEKGREKRPVIHDVTGNWVRCHSCRRVLFPLRRNCQNCPFYSQLLDLWKKKASLLEFNFIEYQILNLDEERITREQCLPCAVRQAQFSPHSRTKLLSGFM
ncbi:MAG: hypothetical protein ACFFCQ_10800 [Promethearchaeota archaeon]